MRVKAGSRLRDDDGCGQQRGENEDASRDRAVHEAHLSGLVARDAVRLVDDQRDAVEQLLLLAASSVRPSRSVRTRSASGVPTAAMRRTVNGNRFGQPRLAARASAPASCRARRPARPRTRSSAADSDRSASSPCAIRPVRTSQRCATGTRCSALASERRTSGDRSARARPANRCSDGRSRDCCLRPASETAQLRTYSLSASRSARRSSSRSPPVTCSAQIARSLRVGSACSRNSALSRACTVGVRPALLQDPARVLHVPVVAVELQIDELVRRQLLEVHPRPGDRSSG